MKLILSFLIASLFVGLFATGYVEAQSGTAANCDAYCESLLLEDKDARLNSPDGFVCFCSPTQHSTLNEFVKGVVEFLTLIAGVLASLLIVFGGFLFMTSGGDQEKIKKGKDLITWGIIGFVVIMLARAIWSAIQFVLTG